jgi:GTP-dependent phosphoenolpyruvate carboxykinase
MSSLLNIDPAEWIEALSGQEDFMKSYGARMPKAMWDQHNELARRIQDGAGIAVKR